MPVLSGTEAPTFRTGGWVYFTSLENIVALIVFLSMFVYTNKQYFCQMLEAPLLKKIILDLYYQYLLGGFLYGTLTSWDFMQSFMVLSE